MTFPPLTDRENAHFYFEDYDLDAQLIAIRGFLARAREVEDSETEEIKRLAARAEEVGSEHLIGTWTDAAHATVYSDAARSAAAVGMLAPFVENLFTGVFRGIGQMEGDHLGRDKDSKRSARAREIFWNPKFVFEQAEVRTDLVSGILQLAEASTLTPHLPKDLKPVLDALFGYRNNILHNGFEWPPERREAFGRRVANWPKSWFASATSAGEVWVWYMTDAFIARVLALIEEVLVAAGQHICLHYEGEACDGTLNHRQA